MECITSIFLVYLSFLIFRTFLRASRIIMLLCGVSVYHIIFIILSWELSYTESLLHVQFLGRLLRFLVLVSGIAGFLAHSLFLKVEEHYIKKLFSVLLISMFLARLPFNLITFYIIFETRLWPILFLILGWGYQPERLKAGLWIALYTLIASLPFLVLILILLLNSDLRIITRSRVRLERRWCNVYLVCLLLAFLVKFPIFFVHLWLPKAHVEAPVAGSIFLAAILLKLGGLGVYFVLRLFIKNYFLLTILVLILRGGTLIRILCTWQKDAKVLIAYSSVSHIALARALLVSSASKEAFLSRLLIILSHGISSSYIFCLANSLYKRRHTRVFTLQKNFLNILPIIMFRLFFGVISNIAAPPTFNFFVEVIARVLLFSYRKLFALFVGVIIFFSASYSVVIYLSVSQGSRSLNKRILIHLSSRELSLFMFHIWAIFWFLFLL